MPDERGRRALLPPRWFIRLAWKVHREIYRVTGGRRGIWRPTANRWGAMRLTTTGRRTGRPRGVIIAYFEDGANLVGIAMNGWAPAEPAWWLNLQAHPEATIEMTGGRRAVTGRAAKGVERSRLWARWRELDRNLDVYAARRPGETAVVVFEPSPDPAR